MGLLFNLDGFLALVKDYNLAVWPLQVAAYVLGVAVLLLAVARWKYSGRIISGVLAFFWLWTGGVFNLGWFRPFYPLAIAFVFLFIAQGIIFAAAAANRPPLSFRFRVDARTFTAALMALYALLGYPLLESLWNRGFPYSLSFGLVPCPTTLFTLAILLLADRKLPWYVTAVPILYSFGGVVPIASGIHEDIGLVAGGVLALSFLLGERLKKRAA
jgi:hypothetical protein